ncbi:molybdopterin molybdotransferase MoeA [Alteromonas oceanisediminis]|uniref:molybdopterin molybdotransferase MoeA n=1 Tax=Alteromonas oceanisediminis TaxID=2836180 RepID=UPI001BDAB298|nr:gephyrin-like molybdotransferase Glp [Alteromonas oceanisediminis]MBT0587375.1 molybdopterin molybdotransferase MoeA [Alteromonas oceanisediminis]
MSKKPSLMPIDEAIQRITELITPVDEIQTCNLTEALGRVLSQDIMSPMNIPSFDNSAMDGYAFRHADLSKVDALRVVGKSFAGNPYKGALSTGNCVRIMTGALLPPNADTVVMQENTAIDGDLLVLNAPVSEGEAVRKAGGDITSGSIVCAKGKRLSAVDIGLLASLGVNQVTVFRPVNVAVFATGDELLSPGNSFIEGHIFDSNTPMLTAMLQRLGAQVVNLGIIKDQPKAIEEALKYANAQADCVITSGGVSVGEADYTRQALSAMGQVNFWKLAIKPGKPLAFGTLPDSVFFGLPGNPVSSAVTFDHIVQPALALMSGEARIPALRLIAQAAQPFRKSKGRTDFQRACCFTNDVGQLMVYPSGSQSSGVLSSFSKSNCYAVLPQEQGAVSKGENVTIELFSQVIA